MIIFIALIALITFYIAIRLIMEFPFLMFAAPVALFFFGCLNVSATMKHNINNTSFNIDINSII